MAEPNDLLRGARERVGSPYARGDCLSRQEPAELVNAWVFERTGRVLERRSAVAADGASGVKVEA